jgi:hypothetical protein
MAAKEQQKRSSNYVNRGYKFNNLKFIRIFDLNLIPRDLIEQVKNTELNTDLLYQIGDNVTSSPFTLLYAISNEESGVVGVLWASVAVIEDTLWGQMASVRKEYQDGTIIPAMMDFLQKIRGELGLGHLKCITTRPRALERYGWKRSKNIIMEV